MSADVAVAGVSTGDSTVWNSLYLAPYITCDLLAEPAISKDGDSEGIRITCVEFWNGNLYIGTSAGEILHYVAIPPDPSDSSSSPTFIYASRREPDFAEATSTGNGIEQILLVPFSGKACILNNGTLTFYSLPELSPAYSGRSVPKCRSVGGIDLDEGSEDVADADGVVIVYSDENRVRLIRIGDNSVKPIRTIGISGCISLVRRGSIACAADSRSYSLIEVVEQQAIPLFEICSQVDTTQGSGKDAENKPLPSLPDTEAAPGDHSAPDASKQQADESTSDFIVKTAAPGGSAASNTKESIPRSSSAKVLKPNIVSPTPSEFLLTTGTYADEEGVGIFVNLEGDVSQIRGTLQFSRYPDCLLVDGQGIDPSAPQTPSQPQQDGYVLAVVGKKTPSGFGKVIEVQRWDMDASTENDKHHLSPTARQAGRSDGAPERLVQHIGMRKALSGTSLSLPMIKERLALRKARVSSRQDDATTSENQEDDAKRELSESQFIDQVGQIPANILLWTESTVLWAPRTPSILQLDTKLDACATFSAENSAELVHRHRLARVIQDMQGLEAHNELDFFTFKYIRQKGSLLLFLDLLVRSSSGVPLQDHDFSITQEALIRGEIDPRIVLAAVPILHDDVFGAQALWMQGGLASVLNLYLDTHVVADTIEPASIVGTGIFHLLKAFLIHWRQKKGFGSVADEQDVFKSVDAALLHLLLVLDSNPAEGLRSENPTRSELNNHVDSGLDCFDYAIELCERYQRLYVLSRLYQSKRQAAQVLSTWKRIVEGEHDAGGGLPNAEERIKVYLRQRKRPLVEEYGTWLAQRNPSVGVQVFADPESQTKFQPKEVVELLKQKAPNAVKNFLEHLVFANSLAQYANDLVGYYLEAVIEELERSEASRSSLRRSYDVYKALDPPKPTYSQFITSMEMDAEWQRSRIRLLQLLGGSQGAASQYDIDKMARRIENYKDLLVPETIIMSGRQGRHDEAIRMLTHRLGDFDTAISYCVLGGSSTYSPLSRRAQRESMPTREEQTALFKHLLSEFLRIEDPKSRISQVSELLERFSRWFDLEEVLTVVPEEWSVERLSGFLERSIRTLVTDRNDAVITRALLSTANLSASVHLLEKTDALGSILDSGQEVG